MAVSTRRLTTDGAGAGEIHVQPCFFAGWAGDGGTVHDAEAGDLDVSYEYGSMPFIKGDLTVASTPDTEVVLYLNFTA